MSTILCSRIKDWMLSLINGVGFVLLPLYWFVCVGKPCFLTSDEPRCEPIKTYQLDFVVKLLWKYFACSTTQVELGKQRPQLMCLQRSTLHWGKSYKPICWAQEPKNEG